MKYTGPCLLGLPEHILDKIISLVLPIKQQSLREISADGLCRRHGFHDFHSCNWFYPILRTCRQLRYQYGQRYCT